MMANSPYFLPIIQTTQLSWPAFMHPVKRSLELAWLTATRVAAFGLKMATEAIRIAVGLRQGASCVLLIAAFFVESL